ncbi:membrane protein [Mycobacterium phage Collard]|uniref:Membrane protein n=1 Tax=Mycobacterium phage Collard TaxID=2301704 RepID=A0A385DUS4_9CAUD|nr:membrane protein [Mycobacterium phage Collard]AXQ63216.1 membrane protein [Mycobacterium phage Collard]UEM46434.1 hypothetical protein SEA_INVICTUSMANEO_40 [Mycobacterium phage InvictusManeo]
MTTLDLIASASTRAVVPGLIAVVWYRRRTWSNRWEQPITLHLVLLTIGITAATHLVSVAGPFSQLIYTHGIDTYIGDVAALFGLAVIASTMLTRVSFDDHDAQRLIDQRVMPIVTLAPALMFGATLMRTPGPGFRDPEVLFPSTEYWLIVTDWWHAAYWCIFYISCAVLASIAAWAARIIATDKLNRVGAHMWLLAMRCTVFACVIGIINAMLPVHLSWLVWMASALVATIAAVAAFTSWRRRMKPFRRLLRFTHTTREERRICKRNAQIRRHYEGDEPAPAV